MTEVTKWKKSIIVGYNEANQVDAEFRPLEGEFITPRDINLYIRALKRNYFIYTKKLSLSKRLEGKSVSSSDAKLVK